VPKVLISDQKFNTKNKKSGTNSLLWTSERLKSITFDWWSLRSEKSALHTIVLYKLKPNKIDEISGFKEKEI
jgi:hypothetical protein